MTTPSAMANFKIFQSLKFYMKVMGIFEVKLTVRNHKIPISFFQRVFILSYTCLCGLSFIWYCLFEAVSAYEFIEPFYLGLGQILILTLYSVLLWKRDQIDHLIELIEGIIVNRINSTNLHTAHQKYFDANVCVEKWTSNTFKIILNAFNPLLVAPVLSLYFYKYFTEDSIKLLYYASFPYDWKKPVAYVFTMIFQASQFFTSLSTVLIFPCFFAGCCQFLIASTEDIKAHWRELSEDAKNRRKIVTIRERIKMKKKLHGIIQFHGDVKELTGKFSDFFRINIVIIWTIVLICAVCLLLESTRAYKMGDFCVLLRSLMIMTSAYFWIFGFCFFGDRVTTAFEDLSESVYQCNWYLFPLEMRKYIPIILMMAQKPVHMHGFAGYHCTLETFKKVIDASYQIFATLKEII